MAWIDYHAAYIYGMPIMKSLFPLLILIGLLQACVTSPPLTPIEFKQHQALIDPINNWEIQGKLGIKAPSESLTASINWKQATPDYVIQLRGPLGQKSLRIEGNNKQISLRENDKPAITSQSAKELFKQTTGWELPLDELNYWVRGLAAPGKINSIQFNEQGLIKNLAQHNWQIEYQQYQLIEPESPGIFLPKKMIVQYKELRLTLIIRNWIL